MTLVYLLIMAFIIMLASLVGVLFVSKGLSRWTETNMQYLIAFASGVFLVVSYNLVFEAFEFGSNKTVVILSIIAGFLIFFFVERLYPETHCHHGDSRCVSDKNKKTALRVQIGDAFHNIADGMLLAPIFVADVRLGFIAGVGIVAHEMVQEISEFFVLKSAGYTNKQALFRNFIVSGTVVIGAIVGFYIASFEAFIGPLIGFASGAFVYILFIDLLPESIKRSHSERKYLNYIVWTLLGVIAIISINKFAHMQLEGFGLDSHGHVEEEHDVYEESKESDVNNEHESE